MSDRPESTRDVPGPSGRARKRGRWRPWLGALIGLVALAVAGLLALRHPAVGTALANAVLGRIAGLPRSKAHVAEVRGDWLTGLELRGLRVTRGDTLLAAIDTLRVRHSLLALLGGTVHVRDLAIRGAIVTTDVIDTTRRAPPTRRLTYADIVRGRFYGGPRLRVDRIAIDDGCWAAGANAPDTALRIEQVSLHARDFRLGGGFEFVVDSLAARGSLVPESMVGLRFTGGLEDGRIAARTLDLRFHDSGLAAGGAVGLSAQDTVNEIGLVVRSTRFELDDLETLFPGLGLVGAVTADIDVRGPRLDRLSGAMAASADRVHVGTLEFGASRLDATFEDGRADARLATAWAGTAAEVAGWIRPLDAVPTYDLEARAEHLSLVRDATARGRAGTLAAALRVMGSGYGSPAIEATGHADGEAGHVELAGRLDRTRGLEWDVERLRFEDLDVARLLGDTTACVLNGSLVASGRGTDVRTRRMTATLEMGPSRYGIHSLEAARVEARVNGEALGGSLRLESAAGDLIAEDVSGRWDDIGSLRVRGMRVEGLDLAALTGSEALRSRIAARVDADLRGLARLGGPGGGNAAIRDGRLTGTADVALAPSEFRGQAITSGSAQVALASGAAEIDAALETQAGALVLDATTRPFGAPPTHVVHGARFRDVDLAAWTGSSALRSRLSGTLAGTMRAARAPDREPEWNAALHLDASQLGYASVTDGRARAAGSGDRLQVDAEMRTEGGAVTVNGDAVLRGDDTHGRGTATLPLGLIAAALGDSLTGDGHIEARVDFTGAHPATAVAEAHVTGSGRLDRMQLDSLRIDAALRDGTVRVDTIALASNVGTVAGGGDVALFDSTRAGVLRVAVAITEARPLRALLRADTIAVGSATLDAHVAGTPAHRTFELRSAVRSFAWNSVRAVHANATASGTLDRTWQPTHARVDATFNRVDGLPLPIADATVQATLDDGVADFDITARRDPTAGMRLTGSATRDSAGFDIALARFDVQADTTQWSLEQPARIAWSPDRLDVENFDLHSRAGRVVAAGTIDRRGEQDFRLDATGVGLRALSVWLGRENLDGRLDGRIALAGPAGAPRGDGAIDLALVSDGEPAGHLRSVVKWDGSRLDLDGAFATPPGDSLAWTGHLPLAVSLAPADSASPPRVGLFDGPVDVRVTASRFPLAALAPFLDPASVGPLDGTLDVNARLAGTGRSLVGSGRIDVIDAVVPLPGLGVTYKDIDLAGTLAGDRFLIERAHAQSGKGRFDATGEMRFVSLTRIEPKVHVEIDKFEFADANDLRAVASGAIDVTGAVGAPVVKGRLVVENSSFTIVQSDLAQASEVRLTDADVRMMEEAFGHVRPPTAGLPQRLYDASDLDLDITLKRDNWVRQRITPRLAVAFTGNVHLVKPPHGEPHLTGRIEPIPGRGYVEQFARSFDITGGEVLLNGAMKDHAVDLQAQYKIPTLSESDESDVTINLDVEGTPEKLKLLLSSEPAMSDAEIVSYIATGRAPVGVASTGTTTGGEANLARDIGLAQITNLAGAAAQGAVGLDVLTVRYDALQGATLVAGRYLDPELYVGFRQPLQYKDAGSPTSTSNARTSFELEYAIEQWLVLNLQGETAKLRSFLRARHAY
jgi:translocation and assembly module TamB